MAYEKKVQAHFQETYGDNYIPSPWLRFHESGDRKVRWCQPDGLIVQPWRGVILVVEFKLQHTSLAWWQTRHLYMPVLAAIFPPELWQFAPVEVVRWFDPATPFPERPQMLPDVLGAHPGKFGVHIWNG